MIYSMLAVLAAAVVLWAFIPGEGTMQRRTDAAEVAASSWAEDVDFPVYVPVDLDDGWVVSTATITMIGGQETWRVGVQTPSGGFVALSQTAETTEEWRAAVVRDTAALSEQSLDGPEGRQAWRSYIGGNALAFELLPGEIGDPGTVVYTQSAPDEIYDFIAHLEVAEPVS